MTRTELQEELRISRNTACKLLKKNLNKEFVTKIGNKYIIDREKFFEWYNNQEIV